MSLLYGHSGCKLLLSMRSWKSIHSYIRNHHYCNTFIQNERALFFWTWGRRVVGDSHILRHGLIANQGTEKPQPLQGGLKGNRHTCLLIWWSAQVSWWRTLSGQMMRPSHCRLRKEVWTQHNGTTSHRYVAAHNSQAFCKMDPTDPDTLWW